jgi:hypothetical protein
MSDGERELPIIEITNDEIWLYFETKDMVYLIRHQGLTFDNNQDGTIYMARWGNESRQVLVKHIADVELCRERIYMAAMTDEAFTAPVPILDYRVKTLPHTALEPYAKDSGFETVGRWSLVLTNEFSNEVPDCPDTKTFDLLEISDFKKKLEKRIKANDAKR